MLYSKDPPQPLAAEVSARVAVNALEHVELPTLHQRPASEEVQQTPIVLVEELPDRSVVLVGGDLNILTQLLACTGLKALEQVQVLVEVA